MNRRELLAVAGVGAMAAVSRAGCGVPKPTNYLEFRLHSARNVIYRFEIEEFAAPGKPIGDLRSQKPDGITVFLTRTAKNPTAPKDLRLIVENSASLELVWDAVKSIKTAGFAQLRYYGCIPPGCGITAGATNEQKRLEGTVFKTEELDKILSVNSTKC